MNWNRIEGQWKQIRGKARQQWGQLMDDDLDVAAGRREQLVGRVQQRYGVAREEAERQLADRQRQAGESWFSRSEDAD